MSEQNIEQFGRVAVLMGGQSAEREISLKSGRAVLDSLMKSGVDAVEIDVGSDVAKVIEENQCDRAFIVLHGRGGEDGTIQGLLESIGIPYSGSGVLGSALAMDKLRTKQIWSAIGLNTPDFMVLDDAEDCDQALDSLGLPLIVKPVLEGSSIGMTKVDEVTQLIPAMELAKATSSLVIAERWVQGAEYTAAILNGQVLPLIRLETPRAFYDYIAKYEAEDTRYICPCGLAEDDETRYSEVAIQAFNAVGAQGWGRVDFIVDESGSQWLIEVNTVPGMTDHSLVPMAAKESGVDFDELVIEILRTSL